MHRLLKPLAFISLVLSLGLACLAADEPQPIVPPTDEDKALAKAAIALAEINRNNAGREQSNFLLNSWPRNFTKVLLGETPATEKQLADARGTVGWFVNVLAVAHNWPQPPRYRVPRAEKAPVIDGKIDEAEWKNARVISTSFAHNVKEPLKAPATTWRLMWDEKNLYMAATCADADIIAPTLPRDGETYNFDCVELFLLPDMAKMEYWELEFGATGSIFDKVGKKKSEQWGSDFENKDMAGLKVATTVNGTVGKSDDKDTEYMVEVAVPWNELPGLSVDFTTKQGFTLKFLLARMDKNEKTFTAISPFPVLSWTHNVWNYATMELVDKIGETEALREQLEFAL